jgi:lysyl-tRNA synthetase, class II
MADSGAVKEAETAVVNLTLDEVTGEKVSKSELKRRQKARERDAKKKEKETVAPHKVEKRASVEDEESDLTPNVGIHHFDLLRVIWVSSEGARS